IWRRAPLLVRLRTTQSMIAERPRTSFALFNTRERPDLRRSTTVKYSRELHSNKRQNWLNPQIDCPLGGPPGKASLIRPAGTCGARSLAQALVIFALLGILKSMH